MHEYYNEYMDELEFAARCGFDAIRVNEHHGNAYGTMPSPNLVAAALLRRVPDAASASWAAPCRARLEARELGLDIHTAELDF